MSNTHALPPFGWFIFTRVIVYTVLIIVILLAFSAVRYGAVTDYPKCHHRPRKHLQARAAEVANDPLASDAERAAAAKAATECPLPIMGCGGHHADSLEIGSLKTGDILVLSYAGLRSWFSAVTYGSVWTHPGLIYIDKDTGEPYIMEAAAYRPPYIGQIVRIPLLKWMSINRNARAVALLRLNQPAPSNLIHEGFERFEKEDIGVEGLRWSWTRFLTKKSPKTIEPESFFASIDRRKKPSKKVKAGKPLFWPLPFGENNSSEFDYLLTCHEVVINTLQHAGVFEESITACSYLPSAVYNREIPTVNGFKYSDPVEVSFDAYVSTSALTIEKVGM